MTEMFFSVDVETDGPIPGRNSMLSIGIIPLHPDTLEETGDEFYATLERLPTGQQDPDTMRWWSGFPTQYAEAIYRPNDPELVMLHLDHWVTDLIKKFSEGREKPLEPIFVAYPASFDFMFYAYYAHRFLRRSVFGFSALDMGSLAMGLRSGTRFNEQSKKAWPGTWVKPEDRVAIHNALADARQQADIFRRMMRHDHSLRWFAGRAAEQMAFSARVIEQRNELVRVTQETCWSIDPGGCQGYLDALRTAARAAKEQPTECITMAAVRHADGSVYVVPRPGRHWNVLDVMRSIGKPYNAPGVEQQHEQGFVTDHGRFVSRKEAKTIATAAGQLLERTDGGLGGNEILYSEDIW